MPNYDLLSVSDDAKTVKGEKQGYLTGILYLAPSDASGVINTCPYASKECREACLYTSGMAGVFPKINEARVRKTLLMVQDRQAFIWSLRDDINKLLGEAKQKSLTPCVRLNGTSDLPEISHKMTFEYPEVQFYDYTKIPKPWLRLTKRPNYHLTFSYSGHNLPDCLKALQHSINVAVVFDTRKGQPLPEEWHGYRVIDGDVSDLRFLDERPRIVGLRAKGRARKLSSEFVQIAKA